MSLVNRTRLMRKEFWIESEIAQLERVGIYLNFHNDTDGRRYILVDANDPFFSRNMGLRVGSFTGINGASDGKL